MSLLENPFSCPTCFSHTHHVTRSPCRTNSKIFTVKSKNVMDADKNVNSRWHPTNHLSCVFSTNTLVILSNKYIKHGVWIIVLAHPQILNNYIWGKEIANNGPKDEFGELRVLVYIHSSWQCCFHTYLLGPNNPLYFG